MKKSPFEVTAIPVGPFVMNCYVVKDNDSGKGILIDPGDSELERILKTIDKMQVDIVAAVGTHGHLDHVGQAAEMKKRLAVPFYFHRADQPLLDILDQQAHMFGLPTMETPEVDTYLTNGESIQVGSKSFRVIHAPGHSPGSICLVSPGLLFSGDVLFQGSIGRTDLWGGDYQTLIDSIKKNLLTLDTQTLVYPGHGPSTSIEQEKLTNPFLNP